MELSELCFKHIMLHGIEKAAYACLTDDELAVLAHDTLEDPSAKELETSPTEIPLAERIESLRKSLRILESMDTNEGVIGGMR